MTRRAFVQRVAAGPRERFAVGAIEDEHEIRSCLELQGVCLPRVLAGWIFPPVTRNEAARIDGVGASSEEESANDGEEGESRDGGGLHAGAKRLCCDQRSENSRGGTRSVAQLR